MTEHHNKQFIYQGFLLAQVESSVSENCAHHGQVDVAGVHLHVDLPVDEGLGLLVKVLAHPGHLVVLVLLVLESNNN